VNPVKRRRHPRDLSGTPARAWDTAIFRAPAPAPDESRRPLPHGKRSTWPCMAFRCAGLRLFQLRGRALQRILFDHLLRWNDHWIGPPAGPRRVVLAMPHCGGFSKAGAQTIFKCWSGGRRHARPSDDKRSGGYRVPQDDYLKSWRTRARDSRRGARCVDYHRAACGTGDALAGADNQADPR
jgi:hypothetical protein